MQRTRTSYLLAMISLGLFTYCGWHAGAVNAETRLEPGGFGEVRIGMTPAQASATIGTPFRTYTPQAVRESCYYTWPAKGPRGLEFMVSKGMIARIGVREPGVFTAAGAQIGTPESELKRIYGASLTWMSHVYVDGGHYAEFTEDHRHYIVFETDGNKITYIRSGRLPEVKYIERCG